MGLGLGICILNELPDDDDPAGPGPQLEYDWISLEVASGMEREPVQGSRCFLPRCQYLCVLTPRRSECSASHYGAAPVGFTAFETLVSLLVCVSTRG